MKDVEEVQEQEASLEDEMADYHAVVVCEMVEADRD